MEIRLLSCRAAPDTFGTARCCDPCDGSWNQQTVAIRRLEAYFSEPLIRLLALIAVVVAFAEQEMP